MSNRLFPDFQEAIEWNLVRRESYQVPENPTPLQQRLPARQFLIENSHVLIIGVRSTSARSGWFTGGWASQILPFLPSSTTSFPAAVQSSKHWLRLGVMTLIVFPRIIPTWILDVSFPYWLNDVSIEIWRYDGRDLDVFQRIDALEIAIEEG